VIGKLALLLLPAINLSGGEDTPINPITDEEITIVILASDTSQDLCNAYPDFVVGLNGAVEDYDLATELAEDWVLVEYEQAYDPTGLSRLTNEAREVMLDWLHHCPAPFQP
jgi:hypothetical protein